MGHQLRIVSENPMEDPYLAYEKHNRSAMAIWGFSPMGRTYMLTGGLFFV